MYILSHGCWNQIKEVTEVTNNFSSQFTLVLFLFFILQPGNCFVVVVFSTFEGIKFKGSFRNNFLSIFLSKVSYFSF